MVIFNKDAIDIEYLVAFRRMRNYCQCGAPFEQRMVTKASPNKGRPIKWCSARCDAYQYGYMLPRCLCDQPAAIEVKKNGGDFFFKCGANNKDWDSKCDFVDWDASCLEAPEVTIKAPFKGKRRRYY